MNTTIIARPTKTGAELVAEHATPMLELSLFRVNSGPGVTPRVGTRYVVLHSQGPFGSRFNKEYLSADVIKPADPGPAGLNPEPGHQWGWDDDEDSNQFVFTVIGVYILDTITPNMTDLTFSASFHQAPDEVTA